MSLGAIGDRLRRALFPPPRRPDWVRIAWARNEPEADLIAARLRDAGIPPMIQRTSGADVPDMGVGGPRVVLVPVAYEIEGRALLDPYEPIRPGDAPAEPR